MNKPIVFTDNHLTKLINQYKYQFSSGDIVGGTIFSVEKEGVLVDIGTLKLAYLPKQEISIESRSGKEDLVLLRTDEIHEFIIVATYHFSQQFILSIRKLQSLRSWQRIIQMSEEDLIVYGKAIKNNSGGMVFDVEKVSGFVPNSHIPKFTKKQALLTKVLPLKILEVNRESSQLILSYKNALNNSAVKDFTTGNIVYGKIKSIRSYGLLIEVSGITGLLHTSEMKENEKTSFDYLYKIGEELKVKVLHVSTKEKKMMFSTKDI